VQDMVWEFKVCVQHVYACMHWSVVLTGFFRLYVCVLIQWPGVPCSGHRPQPWCTASEAKSADHCEGAFAPFGCPCGCIAPAPFKPEGPAMVDLVTSAAVGLGGVLFSLHLYLIHRVSLSMR
jgi:hypothetical protein